MINDLAKKIDVLEKNNNRTNETEHSENIIDEDDMNTTFINPYHGGFPCDVCDFIAKSRSGLGIHVNSKHKEEIVESESNDQ